MSHTRLVATKAQQKKSTPPKGRASSPPPAIAKSARWTKSKASEPPPASPAPAALADEKSARGGVSKNELKAQFGKLSAATSQIASLKRSLNKSFFEVGLLLNQIRVDRLYEVKGYGSFEAFVEREIDINKALCLKLTRVAEALQRDQALAAGLDRAAAAVAALDGETDSWTQARPAGSPAGGVPLHKQ